MIATFFQESDPRPPFLKSWSAHEGFGFYSAYDYWKADVSPYASTCSYRAHCFATTKTQTSCIAQAIIIQRMIDVRAPWPLPARMAKLSPQHHRTQMRPKRPCSTIAD